MTNTSTKTIQNSSLIDGTTLYDCFISGAGNIILNERLLNRINVFPVPDGDTGTNLALTMRTVISNAKRETAVFLTMETISRAASENAYGNSGMIFAEFLRGFYEAVRFKEKITHQEFVDSSQVAVEYAYKAVLSPKEGTILTVMRAWTGELKRQIEKETMEAWLSGAVDHVRQQVKQTKQMMKVLRDNNVVDSGAKAFLLFLEGMLSDVRLGSGASSPLSLELMGEDTTVEPVPLSPLNYRYCCQFTLEMNTGNGPDAVAEALQNTGDSLVLTGEGRPLLRVHLHANDPAMVMADLMQHGQVISHKVDDMVLQQEIVRHKNRCVGIVTDSIADLPASVLRSGQVAVIPLHVIHDGTAYLDKVTMTADRFYREIDGLAMNPTSAQPTAASLERMFRFMLSNYDAMIGIFVSGKMSGLYRNACMVAKRLSSEGHEVRIFDSRLNSAAQGLLVQEAIEMADQGMGIDEMMEKLHVAVTHTRIYVSVESLKYMIKGGRVSKAKGAILSALKLKPVVSINPEGKGVVWAKTFTRRQALKKILSQLRKDNAQRGILRYGLVYADDSEPVRAFGARVARVLGQEAQFIEPISPVVGLNAGRGAFAIAYRMR